MQNEVSKKLQTLKVLLGGEQVILTGSCALCYYGLIESSNDIDLIVFNPSEDIKKVLDRFQEANPSPKFKPGGSLGWSFFYEGVKVDVWVSSNREASFCTSPEGFALATIKNIVAAKKSYNRAKDWVQLKQLAVSIFNPSEFGSTLMSIRTDTEEYDPELDKTPLIPESPKMNSMPAFTNRR